MKNKADLIRGFSSILVLQYFFITIPFTIWKIYLASGLGNDTFDIIMAALVPVFLYLLISIISGMTFKHLKDDQKQIRLVRTVQVLSLLIAALAVLYLVLPGSYDFSYLLTLGGNVGEWEPFWHYVFLIAIGSLQAVEISVIIHTNDFKDKIEKRVLNLALLLSICPTVIGFFTTFILPDIPVFLIIFISSIFVQVPLCFLYPQLELKQVIGKRIKKILLHSGLSLIFSAIFFVVIFYLFFSSNFDPMYYAPYDYPITEPTLGMILFWTVIGILCFLAIVFGKEAVENFRMKNVRKIRKHKYFRKFVTGFAGAWAIFALLGGSILLPIALETIPFHYHDTGPYLTWSNGQDPTNSITVCWHSSWNTGSMVEYGLSPDNLDRTASAIEFDVFHHVKISGLEPDTTYYYKVQGFDLKQFTTAPDSAHNFTFAVWSDPRTNNGYNLDGPNMPELMHEILGAGGYDPAFSLCTGDIVQFGVYPEVWKLWLEDITTDDFASNRSHVVAIGNHARHSDPTARNFHKYYPYDNTSFSFDFGQVHFIILDIFRVDVPEPYSWWDKVPAHLMTWMQNDLTSSNATFKVLALHPTPITSGGLPINDTHCGDIGEDLTNLAINYGLDAIFSGHWHRYTHALYGGCHIFTLGVGGNDGYSLDGGSGFLRVDVGTNGTNSTMYFDVIKSDTGTSYDSYAIIK
ncbi:MAG: fibronectin type III domain-containing protein [Candidatus Hodarchaeota archaeon]